MHIDELRNNNELINLFCNLVQIPSPSLSEDKLIDWISTFLNENNINFELDNFKNIIIKVNATNPHKQPILLSAHLDVVGDFSPINLVLKGDFIETDKTRTLGADDKAGVACALLLAREVSTSDINHGGLEIVLTRDEEHGMTGIKNIDFKSLKSKYILVLDSDKLGQLLISGASYSIARLVVNSKFGGHSGLDIGDKNRLNCAKLIAELVSQIPQGVYYENETGVITSINLGTIFGGEIQNSASKILSDKIVTDNYADYFLDNAVTNVINTSAKAAYSIRSADTAKEAELKDEISGIVSEFNKKYEGLASAEVTFKSHLLPFQKSDDKTIIDLHTKACKKLDINQKVSSFHAGAETHIYAQNKNFSNENFLPFLLGTADIFNMHSVDEKINHKTLLQGYSLLKELFISYNNTSN